jgi:heat shock protein HslJ
VFTASCSEDAGLTSPTTAAQLDGTWRLYEMTDSSGVHREDLSAGRFSVTFSIGSIQVKADCNTCAGAANLSGSTLTVNALGCSRAACSSAPVDGRFTTLLSGAQTVRLNDRLLQLNAAQGGELRFER